MSIALSSAEAELSRQLGDYWGGTTTSAGSATAIVDTGLMAKANDWVTDDSYDQVTSGTYGYGTAYDAEERKISSLSNTDGTLTVLSHTGAPGITVTYRVHRLFTASEKRRALVSASKTIFANLFKEIRDESIVSGNWLKDGSFEIWTASTNPTYWSNSSVTSTQTTSSPYYKHGLTSCLLSGTAGYIYQSISEWDDLKYLAGKSVTFSVQGYSSAASSLRIAIYDGTTTTYSSYHDGGSAWTEDNDPLEVTAQIQDNPTAIEFRIYYASGTCYVDDARVITGTGNRIYIGNLGLTRNTPHQVLIEPSNYSTGEPWILIHGITYDSKNGYMYLPDSVSSDYRLRILGIGYLDFLVSGSSATTWAATIDIDAPQLEILVAQAAIYLCNQKIVPTDTAGTSQAWAQAKNYWDAELNVRKAKFGMTSPSSTIKWFV